MTSFKKRNVENGEGSTLRVFLRSEPRELVLLIVFITF